MKVLDMHCDTITRLYEEYPNESLLENTGHIDLKKMQKGDYLLPKLCDVYQSWKYIEAFFKSKSIY